MKWFETYTSNTMGGTGNQYHFATENDGPQTGRVYYKIFTPGEYNYSLLFSNVIDSTYRPGRESHCNLICHSWEILGAWIGLCKEVSPETAGDVTHFIPLAFDGKEQKTVMPGEFFTTDPVKLAPEDGDYLCLQIRYSGTMIPGHEESVLPTFVEKGGQWVADKRVPVPGMVGCDRKVKARIGYLGDSITQGIGTPPNSYTHWSALVSRAIGEEYSHWNLGIGYAKGQDAASDGAWLYKAKQLDAVVVSFGSNDIGRGRTLEQMKVDFAGLVDALKQAGVRVFLQSVPPFNWKEEKLERWNGINAYLVDEISAKCDGFLNIAPLLVDESLGSGMAKYGTHPNEEGCRVWADALIPLFRDFLKKLSN